MSRNSLCLGKFFKKLNPKDREKLNDFGSDWLNSMLNWFQIHELVSDKDLSSIFAGLSYIERYVELDLRGLFMGLRVFKIKLRVLNST